MQYNHNNNIIIIRITRIDFLEILDFCSECKLHSDDDSFPCYLYQILVRGFKPLKTLWTVEKLRLTSPGWCSVTESLNIARMSIRERCSSLKHVTAPKSWLALKSKSVTGLNLSREYISMSPNHVHSDWKKVCSIRSYYFWPKPHFPYIPTDLECDCSMYLL